jgi:DNA-directed RNA polymerase specialized sigma subunit
VLIDDIYDDKLSLIHEAAFTYNPTYKCKFSTWLGNRVRYKCLKEINKRNRSPKLVQVQDNELYNLLENYGANIPNEDFSTYVLTILEGLHDKRIKKIFEYRYFKDWTFTKIGQKMKLSGQAVINLHNLGTKLLKAKILNGDESDRT